MGVGAGGNHVNAWVLGQAFYGGVGRPFDKEHSLLPIIRARRDYERLPADCSGQSGRQRIRILGSERESVR